jgi:hypothetical protein
MVWIAGGKAREMRGIFKLFRRTRRAVAACPKDAVMASQAVVKPLDRALSPLFAPFLVLKRHNHTLVGAGYEFMT